MDTRFLACAFILLFGVYTIKGMLVCPNGWHKHINNQCYWFSDFNTTKQSAQAECESRNSSLVIADSMNINTFLQQHILNDRGISYWLGLSIPNLQGNAWQWTSGLNLDTRHVDWCDGAGILSNFLSACTVAYYFRNATFCLRTYGCTTSRRFVCEKETDRHALCPTHLYNNTYIERRSCYYVSLIEETNVNAAKVCWSKGMRLVAVPDDSARRFLKSISPGSSRVYWVGLSPYKWIDGSAYNWNNWGYGPNIQISCTVLKNDGTWHNVNCSDFNNFICQKGAMPDALSTMATPSSTRSGSITSITYYATTNEIQNIPSSTNEIANPTDMNSVTSPLTTNSDIPALSSNLNKEMTANDKDVLFIIIGIMSIVIVGLTVAVGFLISYIKRRHSNELKTDTIDIQRSRNMYEELATGPYVNGLQQGLSCPYATLD